MNIHFSSQKHIKIADNIEQDFVSVDELKSALQKQREEIVWMIEKTLQAIKDMNV